MNRITSASAQRDPSHPAVMLAAAADRCACAPGDEHRVLVVDADPLLRELLEQWLGECGCHLNYACHDQPTAPPPAGRFGLLVVDIPYPRQGGLELLQRLAAEHPGTPIMALSPTFFGSIGCAGAAARALGVARVLPKPISREALTSAARQLLCADAA